MIAATRQHRIGYLGTLLAVILLPVSSGAATWYILPDGSGDAPTIQAGVDSAAAGDTVLLATGTFTGVGNRDIDFRGQPITVTSEHGPDSTIVDCQNLGRGFYFESSEGPSSVLSRLTIQNGNALTGGGIYCRFAGPTISGNVIRRNEATTSGGGIYHALAPAGADGEIVGNIITGNTAGDRGGGIIVQSGSPSISGNEITGNNADRGGGLVLSTSASLVTDNLIENNSATSKGGGIYSIGTGKTPTIDGNTVVGNTCDLVGGGIYVDITSTIIENTVIANNQAGTLGGGVYCWVEGDPTIRHCTIVGNGGGVNASGVVATDGDPTIHNTIIAFSTHGPAMLCFGTATPVVTCCDIYGNAGGDVLCGVDGGDNTYTDPLFCNIAEGDYTLDPASPCAPANSPCNLLIGALPATCVGSAIGGGEPPRETSLFQNVPNPFNPSTTIRYTVGEPGGYVSLRVYDVTGRVIRVLFDGAAGPGEKTVTWDGDNEQGKRVASGVYFYRLTAPGFARTMKLVVLK
ncbi:MAG: T9SS type A sorting domain-containing protein [Candidatus Latescibacterota bacterium]|nr:MAG: T9SS type A sorting domain-containing protein [Candidatus Latescibacterota bacterium]